MRALAILAAAGAAALAACGTPVSAATPAAWRPVPGARITCHSAVQRDDPDAAVLDVAAAGPAQAWAVGVCGADAGPAGFRFATTPQPPAADPVGGGFLAGEGARIWLGGEDDATRPVIARRAGSGWVTIRVPVTSTYGWIDAMSASGRGLWVRVEESGNAGGSAGRTVLERFDGRSWPTLSAAPVPPPVNWSIAEINAGQGYGGYRYLAVKSFPRVGGAVRTRVTALCTHATTRKPSPRGSPTPPAKPAPPTRNSSASSSRCSSTAPRPAPGSSTPTPSPPPPPSPPPSSTTPSPPQPAMTGDGRKCQVSLALRGRAGRAAGRAAAPAGTRHQPPGTWPIATGMIEGTCRDEHHLSRYEPATIEGLILTA